MLFYSHSTFVILNILYGKTLIWDVCYSICFWLHLYYQDQMRNGRLSRRPATKTSCSTKIRIQAYTSPSRWHRTWGRAATLTCLLWLLTTRKARRSVGWCLDPVLCPTVDLREGTVALKICSMLSSHQEQVSQDTVRCLCLKTLYTWMWSKYIMCFLLERRVPLRLNYSKYGSLLTEDNLIRLGALLFDYTTKESTLAVRNIALENPEIKVRVSMMNGNNNHVLISNSMSKQSLEIDS